MLLSVVIPARNEADNIGPTIDAITDRLRIERIAYEIVVVDDGSTDATMEEVRARSMRDGGVVLVQNTGLHGFGRAIRTGLDVFTGDAVVIMMADGSDSPDDLVTYYLILRDQAECAFGSRWIRHSRVFDYPWFKLAINRVVNNVLKLMFFVGYNDFTNAFKGYRRYVIEGCRPLISPHFNLTVEIPLKAVVRGYSYRIVPIRWTNRKYGTSSLKLEEMGSRYLYSVLNVWLEHLLTRGDYRRADREPVHKLTRRESA